MINVNQITAQLARMPDQALQQYAQMHKDDPYVLSLALSESNRRKQTRQGAQMGGQEQPKVVDQELQGMAAPMPEDVGIGQLPAGDMNFADGGIVAFSGGGASKFDPADAEELRKLAERRLRAEQLRAAMSATPGGAAPAPGSPGFFQYMKDKLAGLRPAGMAGWALATHHGDLNANEEAELRRRQAMGATVDPTSAEIQQAMDAGAFARPTNAGAAPTNTAPKSDTGAPRQRPPAGGTGAAAPSASGPAAPGIAALQSPAQMYQNALEATPLVDPAAGQREALGKEMIGGAQQRMAARQAEIEKEGDVFKGRGERISKREEALGKDKEQMTGLAFLEAGLAVMSTPGGLATALGKGARVGTERFAAGLDKLRAAQERLEDAKDNLETLRLNRSDMNAKEIRAMKADIDRAKLDAQKLGIDGIMQASDLRHKQASEVFKASSEQSLAVLKEAGANQRQQMASAATVQAAKIAAAQRGTRLEDELREQYAKSAVLRAQYPNVKDFLAAVQGTSAVPPVQAQPGAGGVRP